MYASSAQHLVVVEEDNGTLHRRGRCAHEKCLWRLLGDVLLHRRFNRSKTLFDNVHSVKQAFCECEIFFTNGRSIELIPEQSGCQLALALAGEQAEHIREQMR